MPFISRYYTFLRCFTFCFTLLHLLFCVATLFFALLRLFRVISPFVSHNYAFVFYVLLHFFCGLFYLLFRVATPFISRYYTFLRCFTFCFTLLHLLFCVATLFFALLRLFRVISPFVSHNYAFVSHYSVFFSRFFFAFCLRYYAFICISLHFLSCYYAFNFSLLHF